MASQARTNWRNEAGYPQNTGQSPTIRRSRPTRSSRIHHDQIFEMNVDTGWSIPSSIRDTHRRIISQRQSQSLSLSLSLSQNPSNPHLQQVLRNLHRELYGKFEHNYYSSMTSDLKPWRWWKGASKDVVCFAWSPDNTKFAAGAVASEEFNRGNNLLLGDLTRNTLEELPCHYLPSSNASLISGSGSGSGANGDGNGSNLFSTEDPDPDPRCFVTVTKARWIGNRLFTSSLDKTVKIWDVKDSDECRLVHSLVHNAGVTVMDHPRFQPNLLATGTVSEGVYLWNFDSDSDLDGSITSTSAITPTTAPTAATPTAVLLPIECGKRCLTSTALAWGQTFDTRNILVGGMEESNIPPNGTNYGAGHLQVWNIEESSISIHKATPHSQYIFDIKFHPFKPEFATASTGFRMGLPRNTRSVIQIYNLCTTKPIVTNRFLCPALDVNEVTFCPRGSYITASCTDGSTYVWDERNSSKLLHKLSHGVPLNSYHDVSVSMREQVDFGVGVAVWGSGGRSFTGSSDGLLNVWDIRRASEDAFLGSVASFDHGLTVGLFSDDGCHLVVGDAGGGIHVLSSGSFSDPRLAEMTYIHGRRSLSGLGSGSRLKAPESTSLGLSYADELLRSNQLTMHPTYGPVQGPNYSGPFAGWARGLEGNKKACGNVPLLERVQLRQFDGPPVSDRCNLSRDAKDDLQRYFNTAEARAQHIKYLRTLKTSRTIDRIGKASRVKGSAKSKRRACLDLDLDSKRISSKHKEKKKEKEKRHGQKRKIIKPIITRVDKGVIDLMGDGKRNLEVIDLTNDSLTTGTDKSLNLGVDGLTCKPEKASRDTRIWENLEEDYWWPDSRYLDANLNQLLPVD